MVGTGPVQRSFYYKSFSQSLILLLATQFTSFFYTVEQFFLHAVVLDVVVKIFFVQTA